MAANDSALLRYAIIVSAENLTQVIKLNAPGSLRIYRHNRKISQRIIKRLLK